MRYHAWANQQLLGACEKLSGEQLESRAEGTYGTIYETVAPVLRVADLTRSLAFYRDQLGFNVEFVYEAFYAEVCRDGCRIHLNCADPTPRDQAAFERAEYIDACAVVQNAAKLSLSFASAGVPFTVSLRQMPYGTEFYIRDPDGYILGFIEATPAPCGTLDALRLGGG